MAYDIIVISLMINIEMCDMLTHRLGDHGLLFLELLSQLKCPLQEHLQARAGVPRHGGPGRDRPGEGGERHLPRLRANHPLQGRRGGAGGGGFIS